MGGYAVYSVLLGMAAKNFLRTGDGALSSSAGDGGTHGRASDLGGHGGGEPRSDNACRGHCDG